MATIESLQTIVQRDLRPELTILLDAPTEVSAERIAGRDWQDRFEQERAEFFTRVRSGYLAIAGREPNRVRVIDASRPLIDVQNAIRTQLDLNYK